MFGLPENIADHMPGHETNAEKAKKQKIETRIIGNGNWKSKLKIDINAK